MVGRILRGPGLKAVFGLVAGLLALPSSAWSAPIACDPAALVSAVNAANDAPGADEIELAPGCEYTYTAKPNATALEHYWYGPSALPYIASEITIVGNGATIERDAPATEPFRLFYVGPDPDDPKTLDYHSPAAAPGAPADAGPGKLVLRDLTLRGGFAKGGDTDAGGAGAGLGGAIFNQGDLLLRRVTVVGNTAQGGTAQNFQPDPQHARFAGGGIGEDVKIDTLTNAWVRGGGFGGVGSFGGAAGGAPAPEGAEGSSGGGGGFLATDIGEPGQNAEQPEVPVPGGDGGGVRTGLGGDGAGVNFDDDHSVGGNGSGGAGAQHRHTGVGGSFGTSPTSLNETTRGGGVGGGGWGGVTFHAGAGGGFGAGGSAGASGGHGGFGGGGGGATNEAGTGGFGGGSGYVGGGGAGMGGAIFNMQGDVEIRNSTLTANSAVPGGAVVPEESAQGLGGALFNLSGTVEIESSTLAANHSVNGGGALYNLGYDAAQARQATVTIERSVLAGSELGPADVVSNAPALVNGSHDPPANMSSATVTASSNSIVEVHSIQGSGQFTGTPAAVDPQLGPLAANGGGTETFLVGIGSPLIDSAGTGCPAQDQRGLARPAAAACDAGATEVRRPANDNFAAAQSVPGTAATVGGTTVDATAQAGEPAHGPNPAGASVWFSWTAPEGGPATAETCGSAFDTVLVVYTGAALGALTPVVAADDSPACGPGSVQSSAAFEATQGTTYVIAVDAKANPGPRGELTLNVAGTDSTPPAAPTFSGTSPASPANDNSPLIRGSAESGSTVKLFAGADCSGAPIGSGSAAAFADPGIAVTVADDTTTSVRATATDAAENGSACSQQLTYVEDSKKPKVSKLKVRPKRISFRNALPRITTKNLKRGAIRFKVSEDANATFKFIRLGRKPKRARKLVVPVEAGRNALRFSGRLAPRQRLKPGRYKVRLIARDAARNGSKARVAKLTLVLK